MDLRLTNEATSVASDFLNATNGSGAYSIPSVASGTYTARFINLMSTCLNDKYKPEERFRAVVGHGNGLLVVCAGPGTGKTFSLLRKIQSLLALSVDPKQIYYLTFVNSIVDAFRSDAAKSVDEGGLGVDPDGLGIHISTLHSMAFKIVRTYSDELELPTHLEVLDVSPHTQGRLSQLLVNDIFVYAKAKGIVGDKKSFDHSLNRLTGMWRQNLAVEPELASLQQIVDIVFSKYGACPWDRVVPLAITAIQKNGLPKWLQGAQHFLIDEYQDFNPSEQSLISLVTEPSDSVVIVGDPDQSIYSGRSASPQGLLGLIRRADTSYVNFVHCRRCATKIVDAANKLLQYMSPQGYTSKLLQPFKSEEGTFSIHSFKSCRAEIESLVAEIKDVPADEATDIILLFPSSKACQFYRQKLEEAGICCDVRSADTSAERIAAVLRLVVLRHQSLLERFILSEFDKLVPLYLSSAIFIFLDEPIELTEAISRAQLPKRNAAKVLGQISQFNALIEKVTSADVDCVLAALQQLDVTFDRQCLDNLLRADQTVSANERVQSALTEYNYNPEEPRDENKAKFRLMTMHSSKGLSKGTVIIPAFEDKWLPGPSSGDRLAEQHRLMFVALTRAKDRVLIMYPKTRAKGDQLNYRVFGAEAGISRYAKVFGT